MEIGIAEKIERYGWSVVGVTDARVPFAYTVGLTARSLPELYTEVPIPAMLRGAQKCLNEAGALAVEGADLTRGFKLSDGTSWSADLMADHGPLALARGYYGRVTALRLTRPQATGRYDVQ